MSASCLPARRWLASQGVGHTDEAFEASAAHAAHVATCGACKAVLQRYQAFTDACMVTLDHEPSAEAEVRFLASCAPPQGPGKATPIDAARRRRARSKGLAVAAAVAVAAVAMAVWRLAPEEPDAADAVEQIDEDNGGVTVASYSGRVTFDGRSLVAGQDPSVRAGTTVSTDDASHLQLRDGANAVVTVASRSRVEIVGWTPQSTRLVLEAGTIRAQVDPREARELFEIVTPSARVIVVGTEFTVTCSGEGDTLVRGTSGKVRVERRDGSLAGFVTAGAQLRVAPAATLAKHTTAPAEAPVPPPEPSPAEPVELVEAKPEPVESSPEAPLDEVAPEVPKPAPKKVRPKRRRAAVAKVADDKPPAAEVSEAPAVPKAPVMSPLRQARIWLAEGQEAKAVALLLKTTATDWRRDALLGDAYQLSGGYAAAAAAYERALGLASRPPASLLADLATLQEKRLGRPDRAAATWQRYLTTHPNGADAARAHLSVGRAALRGGRTAEADRHFRAILERFPGAREAAAALAHVGGRLLRSKRWTDADRLFAPFAQKGGGRKAEVALGGMIRVAVGQGRADAAARLITRYRARFPKGGRRHEVERLEDALEK